VFDRGVGVVQSWRILREIIAAGSGEDQRGLAIMPILAPMNAMF